MVEHRRLFLQLSETPAQLLGIVFAWNICQIGLAGERESTKARICQIGWANLAFLPIGFQRTEGSIALVVATFRPDRTMTVCPPVRPTRNCDVVYTLGAFLLGGNALFGRAYSSCINIGSPTVMSRVKTF